MGFIKSKKMIVAVAILVVIVLLGVLSPKIKTVVKKRAFLHEIKVQAKEGKMINSPFKIGESSRSITKKWGKPDSIGDGIDENDGSSPFYMDAFSDGMFPEESRSLIYSKNDVKFDVSKNKTIKNITSVDKRLDKLTKKELTNYFGKPTLEFKDYAVYKVGEYQLLFQFWHDGEFFNTTRYTLIPKDSKEAIKEAKEIASLASEGKATGVPVSIGTPIKEVEKVLGKPEEKNIPGSSYSYKEAIFDVDLKTHKIAEILPRGDYSVTFVTLRNTLGTPYKEEIGKKSNE